MNCLQFRSLVLVMETCGGRIESPKYVQSLHAVHYLKCTACHQHLIDRILANNPYKTEKEVERIMNRAANEQAELTVTYQDPAKPPEVIDCG